MPRLVPPELTIGKISSSSSHLDGQADLLLDFALDRRFRHLARIHVASGQRPGAARRVDGPPHQEDAVAFFDQRDDGHLRVGELDEAAGRAGPAHLAFDQALL